MTVNELLYDVRGNSEALKERLTTVEANGSVGAGYSYETFGLLYTAWMQSCQLEATLTLLQKHCGFN